MEVSRAESELPGDMTKWRREWGDVFRVHPQMTDGQGGEGLPFAHQPHFRQTLLQQRGVDFLLESIEQTTPVAHLPEPHTPDERVFEDMGKNENDIIVGLGNFNRNLIDCPGLVLSRAGETRLCRADR